MHRKSNENFERNQKNILKENEIRYEVNLNSMKYDRGMIR